MRSAATMTRQPASPDVEATLAAAREEALRRIIRGVIWVALLALVGFSLTALRTHTWGTVGLYAVLFLILLGLHFAQKMSYRLRAGVFVGLVYAVAIVGTLNLGIGGAGRVFLLGFAVLVTILFGRRVGWGALIFSMLTWAGLAAFYLVGHRQPGAPPDSGVLADWINASTSLLLIMVALVLPQRQFLETQVFAVTASRQKAELEEVRATLEKRTRELEAASRELMDANQRLQEQSRALERRASQLAVSAEVARVAASLRDLPELLQTTVALISERFGFYHAGLFLLDDTRDWAILEAASSPGGQRMLAHHHRLGVGQQGIVGHVTARGQPRIALDVGADAVHFANPDLPETHSEMAVPLKARGEVIGALDVQSVETNAFADEDVKVLQTLADQLGVAIENARLFQETRRNLEELQALQRQPRRPTGPGEAAEPAGYVYDGVEVRTLTTVAEAGPSAQALQVPIRLGEEAFGVIELKREGASWSNEDVTLSEAIAERMALALENARLFEATRLTLAETARLYNASRAIAAARKLDDILRSVIAHALEPYFERFVIGFVDVGPDQRVTSMTLAAVWDAKSGAEYGLGHHYTTEQLPLLRLLNPSAPSLVRSSESRVMDERSRAVFRAQGIQGLAAIPLVAGGALIGVFLAETRDPHFFTPEEIRPLQALADQAASAIQSLRQLEETQQRVAELATINRISQTLASQLELNALLQQVGDQILKIFSVTNGFIALYDRRYDRIEAPYFVANQQAIRFDPIPLGQGLASAILRSRQPLLINQEAARRAAELGANIVGDLPRSFLGVPILAGDDVIGAICVQSLDQEGLFSDADVRLLTTIAANLGVAIQNARLFAETQRRAQQLAAAAEIGRAATSTLDLQALLRTSVELIREQFGFYHASVFIIEPGSSVAMLHESTGEAGRALKARRHQLAVGSQSLVGAATATRQPRIVQDVTQDPTHFKNPLLPDTRAEAVIPLLSGSAVIGALDVQSTTPGAFSESDVAILTTIADQLAVAVQNARLFEEAHRLAAREQTLNQISNKLRGLLDAPHIAQLAIEELGRALKAKRVVLTLGTEAQLRTRPPRQDGDDMQAQES